jgi:serine protease AprX
LLVTIEPLALSIPMTRLLTLALGKSFLVYQHGVTELSGVVLMAQESKLAPDLAGVAPEDTVDVIIQLEEEPANEGGGRRVATFPLPLPRALSSSARVTRFSAFPGVVARVKGSALAALAQDRQVKYISPDREVSASQTDWNVRWKNPPNANVPAVNANLAHAAGFRGAGIGIAVLDSGITDDWRGTPSDLFDSQCKKTRILEFLETEQVFGSRFREENPDWMYRDYYGHGSHVAGIIAGNQTCDAENKRDRYWIGVAPAANLISVRVLDQLGKGRDSRLIMAIDQVIALKSKHNIRVMNLSLGRRVFESYTKDPLCQAVERAWKAGIVVVVAAGNLGRTNTVIVNGKPVTINGYGTIGSPGNDPFVITVGATRDMFTATRNDDVMASYSSKGPTVIDKIVKPDLVAPGNRVASYMPAPGGRTTLLRSTFPQNVTSLTSSLTA